MTVPRAVLPDIPGVWRGERVRAPMAARPTGLQALDTALRGGWPRGALTQIVSTTEGLGFSLLIPALADATQTGSYIGLVQPPFLPYAPALASSGVDLRYLRWIQPDDEAGALWALEQMLRSGLFAAVVFWGGPLDRTVERRLQLAADAGAGLAFCFRTARRDDHSYAATRLAISPLPDAALRIEVLKCRGGRTGVQVLQQFVVP